MNRVHFKTIAAEAGVNVRTVYRVLNSRDAVSDTTRQKVTEALNKHGYTCLNQRKSQNVVFDIVKSSFIERIGI